MIEILIVIYNLKYRFGTFLTTDGITNLVQQLLHIKGDVSNVITNVNYGVGSTPSRFNSICNHKMNIVRIKGMSKTYWLISKVSTLNGCT